MRAEDFEALKAPLIVLVLVLLAGALSVYYTGRLGGMARLQFAQQQKLLQEARTRLQKSDEERDVIVRYLDRYRELEYSGFVGEEQRINWLDGLRIANQQTDLFGVDYEISAQKPYAYAAQFNPGQIALNQSGMRLRFQLVHEGDLLRFLSNLERQGGGIFTVEECRLERLDARGVIRYRPNVAAECELSWITARIDGQTAQKKP